ncbi:hypothetical protein HY385_01330 [Candidatus Daviesbacteria bacterium]|nr:hypothetical protein [Candidatus Daviesbacteria bacterium]
MLIWFLLFFVILAISAVLAFGSMADYRERPGYFATPYALFLVNHPEILFSSAWPENLIISLERLFKGQKRAWVIYGPAHYLRPKTALGLVEIEDYSKKSFPASIAWEMGTKTALGQSSIDNLMNQALLEIRDNEECWWQVVAQPKKGNTLQAIIRVSVQTNDVKRAQDLQKIILDTAGKTGLVLIPEVYSSPQILKFYQERSLPRKVSFNFEMGDIKKLVGV